MESEYKLILENIDNVYVSHFPKDLSNLQLIRYGAISEQGYSDYPKGWLVVKTSKENLATIEDSVALLYDAINVTDSNLLVINDWQSLRKSGLSLERNEAFKEKLECIGKSDYPVPNFYQLELTGKDKNYCQLSNDFELFVIEAKKGKLLDFSMADRRYVPKNWEHGFSRGFAFSKKQQIIIYWYAIW